MSAAVPAISGPEVTEVISIDRNSHPQRPADTPMVAITPRNRTHLVASGSSAPLSSDATQQPYTHQWIPAGDFAAPIDPSVDGGASMPYTSTASRMSDEVLLSKAASLAFSSHIMASGEYAHQTTSVKEWITSFRNLRIKKPSDPASADIPSEMQQVLSSSSIKVQRQGSLSTASASKWTEAYVWISTEDAAMFVLGNLRPTKVQGPTAASIYWHLHRDHVFALTSAFYHQSMAPSYGETSTATEGEAAAEGQPTDEDIKYIKWVL
eukprot:6482122-Amphidinium_carterae.1